MADISSKVWLIVGALVTVASIIFNNMTQSYKFTLFLAAGIIMIIIGIARLFAELSFEKEKKKLDEQDKKEEAVSQQRIAAMEREHKSRMQQVMNAQQERKLAGQHPTLQGAHQCPNCGQTLNAQDRFCVYCGARQF